VGLFSSKTRITVGTQVARVIEDAGLPNSVRSGVYNALFQEDDITGNILESTLSNIGIKAEQMYRYAQANYPLGMPTSLMVSSAQGEDETQAVLEALEGAAVTIDYCRIAPPNSLHIAWMTLVASYGYNTVTNQISAAAAGVAPGLDTYVRQIQITVPESLVGQYQPGSLDHWGTPANGGRIPWILGTPLHASLRKHPPLNVSSEVTEDYAAVNFVWHSPTDPSADAYGSVNQTLAIPILDYDNNADYVHVRYVVGGVPKYWMYKIGSGTYPTIDAVFSGEHVSGTYFPFIYFRNNKVSQPTTPGNAVYDAGRKMLKYLSMDYKTIIDGVNANPDIDDVEQAMMIMAVPAITSNPIEQQYLYDYFNTWYSGTLRSSAQAGIARNLGLMNPNTKGSIIIQDSQFKMGLNHDGLYKRRVSGSIGPVGSSSSATGTTELPLGRGTTYEGTAFTFDVPVAVNYYRRQISSSQYDEIEVVNLQTVYYVLDGYHVTADEDDKILLIPIDRSISDDYSALEREELYSRSLHYVFNSVIITKIRWYQTGLFQFLMIAVAIVITVMSGGTGSGLAAALASGSAAAIQVAVIAILQRILIGLVIQYGLKLFVKAAGIEIAILFAVTAAVIGGFQVLSSEGLKGAPWAKDLLQLSTGLAKASGDVVKEDFEDLLADASAFGVLVQEQLKTLESAENLLKQAPGLNPITIFGEKPEDFYNRTVHSGNVGALGISAISSYVDMALTLPKLKDTLGESYV